MLGRNSMSDLTATAALSSATSVASSMPTDFTLQVPSAGEAAEFTRASAAFTPEQMQAVPPSSDPGLGQTFAQDFNGFAQRVQASQQAFGAERPSTAEHGLSVHETIENSIGGMQNAYAFAIETTMASRGSTETTKVFNTLLKGQ